jgi:hypothetical protein
MDSLSHVLAFLPLRWLLVLIVSAFAIAAIFARAFELKSHAPNAPS